MNAFCLEETFVGWDGQGGATRLPVGPDFWATIDSNPDLRATLISAGESREDWPRWEQHPYGDELVYLLEGEATLILEHDDGEERVTLRSGEAVLVPAGTWHRALVPQPCRMLFVTFGKGTRHRPV
jgi:mannose-6-phosphate isomerase-like protein (cupin superfamily)